MLTTRLKQKHCLFKHGCQIRQISIFIGLNLSRTGSTACRRTYGCRLHAGAPGNTSWSNPYMQGLWKKRKTWQFWNNRWILSFCTKPQYVRASVPFFSDGGQKLVLQAWDIEGLRWSAQPGEGFPWNRHWTILACTPPPHVTVHCRVKKNTGLMTAYHTLKH